ncbi:hypothetical protein CC80DRAFT_458708 [Byssothecium circinans]|uniref:Uncharacterized protein n=1 Tax=Byssothecium circinans TaxID=147558 RepID=A0A6A5TIM2_9PLEO|nr:hypothetical protein CC80DRAFT_458708 [Byssothecium circinans]
MVYLPHRLLHTTRPLLSSPSAQEACIELFTRFSAKPISVRKQLLDANQLHLLNITLGRSGTSFELPRSGTPVPPGHHLVYFTPPILEDELGKDGTDRTVNPLAPYSRRMWAGGELFWETDATRGLKVGQEVQETTRFINAEPKKLKSGDDMLVVGVEKMFENDFGIALTDRRNWVFQKEMSTPKPTQSRPELQPFPEVLSQSTSSTTYTREFTQTPVSLFRFSALTFNAHKIHYSPEWCRNVEGHRDAVVHGPLNLINILDLWRDSMGKDGEGSVPRSVAYRALSPIYVREKYRILMGREDGVREGRWEAELWDGFGKVGMKGTIVG